MIPISVNALWHRCNIGQKTAVWITRDAIRIDRLDELMVNCLGDLHPIDGLSIGRIGLAPYVIRNPGLGHQIPFITCIDVHLGPVNSATFHSYG